MGEKGEVARLLPADQRRQVGAGAGLVQRCTVQPVANESVQVGRIAFSLIQIEGDPRQASR